MKPFLKQIISNFLHFLYPSHCLHCTLEEVSPTKLLCASCSEWLELAELSARCETCFLSQEQCLCRKMSLLNHSSLQIAYACEWAGPAQSLLAQAHHAPKKKAILECMAALMVVQFCRKGWSWPDWIVPSPSNGSLTVPLAQAFSRLLPIPIASVLKSSFLREKELKNEGWDFYEWRMHKNLSDKILLVIADEFRPDDRFLCPLFLLEEACPKQIYLLSFTFSDSVR